MTAGLILLAGGAAAGLFGSLLGLGGGLLIVPLLTLGFGIPLREAVAVSLVSVIVTSSAGAGVYLRRHVANLRLGMVLELFTATGALAGGLIAFLLEERVLAGLFAVLLTWVAVSMARQGAAPAAGPVVAPGPATDDEEPAAPDPGNGPPADPVAVVAAAPVSVVAAAEVSPGEPDLATRLSGPGYRVRRVRFGMAASVGAGVVSALLGVGGGIVKVPVMHLAMGVPLKVATATSNMMIGVTATSSAVIYLLRDEIDPYVAGPTALGVFAGASIGSRIASRVDVRILRWLFVAVMAYTAFEMARRALGL
ncbi:MAG: sulfite exporter TauE/SafE family protein [Chloroflexota bacterium]